MVMTRARVRGHAKQKKFLLTRQQRVTMHVSLKLPFVLSHTESTKENVQSHKEACQVMKHKGIEQNDTLACKMSRFAGKITRSKNNHRIKCSYDLVHQSTVPERKLL